MQVGDLVICRCKTNTWYRGLVGTLVGFDFFGIFNTEKGDPLVMYDGRTIRLASSGLQVVS